MGYTSKTWYILAPYLKRGISVMDFGAQNDYSIPYKPGGSWKEVKTFGLRPPYVSERYKEWDIKYDCIDLNGENGAYKCDLGDQFLLHVMPIFKDYDIVVDAGTKEHVPNLWAAFKNQFDLCKIDGYIYCENPETKSWPMHGHHFFTREFYHVLAGLTGANILSLERHPAMGNEKDGWNIICMMRKIENRFPDRQTFNEKTKGYVFTE